jgi:hypothetical protein
MKITYNEALNAFILVLELSNDSNLSLEIKRRESSDYSTENQFSVSRLDNVFILKSTTSEIWIPVLDDSTIKKEFLALRPYLEFFVLKRQFVEAFLYSERAVAKTVELVMKINPSSITSSSDIKTTAAETLLCYNCGDPFNPLENYCDKCNNSRPRCIVCYQDLKPYEQENIVALPCCNIYAHRNHIVTWLMKKPNCPNCNRNLSRWLSQVNTGD